MAFFPVSDYFILNGKIKPVSGFIPFAGEGGIYEVLRIRKGVPLFIEDHLERLFNSAVIAGRKLMFSKNNIEKYVYLLIKCNRLFEGNIAISCSDKLEIFFINHRYPKPEMYETGISCGILYAERKNPNAKIIQTSVRQMADKLIAEKKYYEVLLVNASGKITEGSRSNVFFVKGNDVFTPKGKTVLPGITRKKVMEIIYKMGKNLFEEEIYLRNIQEFDAMFITGTSPGVLPVKKVDSTEFNLGNELVNEIKNTYEHLVDEYVSKQLKE